MGCHRLRNTTSFSPLPQSGQHFLLNVDCRDTALRPCKLCEGYGKVTHAAPDIDDVVTGVDIRSEYRVWIIDNSAQGVIKCETKPPRTDYFSPCEFIKERQNRCASFRKKLSTDRAVAERKFVILVPLI